MQPKYSVVIPVYRNAASLPTLFDELKTINDTLGNTEFIFVIDGSPDNSEQIIREEMQTTDLAFSLIVLTRNFGAVRASRTGLGHAKGEFMTIMAADLQDPASMIIELLEVVSKGEQKVAVAVRTGRKDPFLTRVSSGAAWGLLRRSSLVDLPVGGFDTYAISSDVRDHLIEMTEPQFSPIAQLLWLGYPYVTVPYKRDERLHGKSTWSTRKRLQYFNDNLFSVTNAPLMFLLWIAIIAFIGAVALGASVLISRITGSDAPQGFTMIIVILLGAIALQQISTVILGAYVWRAYQASLGRPLAVELSIEANHGNNEPGQISSQ